MDADYACSLDEAALKKAKDELYEDPQDRLSSVQTLRKWIQDQHHIACRTDTAFLLRYLRGAKYSQLRARELIENTMTVMTKISEWFRSIDTNETGIQEYLKMGASLPLPKRDKQNRRILLIRPGAVDVKNKHFSKDNEMRTAYCISSLISREEETQVYGYILFFDFTGMSMKHAKKWSIENTKKEAKVWQDCTPGRVKEFHFYNAGTFFEMMMTLFRPFMKKKFLERINVHDNLESLYKKIPKECLPQDYLPDDYTGPHVGSLASVIENNRNTVSSPEFRQYILDSTKPEYGIDMSKKADIPAESFRKLNID